MSNKPRLPFGSSNRDDDDDDEKTQAGGNTRPNSPFNRGGSKPDDRKSDKPSIGSRSPFSRRDDDDDDDEDQPAAKSPSKPGSSFGGSRSPFNRANDDDVDDDEEEEDAPRSSFGGSRPANSSPFGSKPASSFGSNKPNDPPKSNSPFGGSRPATSTQQGNKPNDPPKSNSPFGGSRPATSTQQGNKPGSPFGGPKPGGGSSTPGSKPASPFGSKPRDDDRKDDKPAGGPSGGGFRSPFGAKPGDKPADKGGDKPSGGGPSGGGFRSPFGAKPGDKPADMKDDKPSGGGPLGGGFRSPFGAKPGDKPADKGGDKPSGGGPLGGLRSPFGAKPGDKPADKGGDKPSGGGPLGGLRSPFGAKPGDKPADKPAASSSGGGFKPAFGARPGDKPADKKDDKPAGGGLFGGRLPFGAKPADDKSATSKSAPGVPIRPGGPPAPAGRPGAVAAPPKTAGSAVDPKKAGSKAPPARGEKVARPLERGTKVHVQAGLSLDQKLDLVGWVLMGSGVLLGFALLAPSKGTVTTTIAQLLTGLVGKGGTFALLLPCFGIGIWLFVRHFNENPLVIKVERVIGYALMYVTFVTTVHTVYFFFHDVKDMAALIKASADVVKNGDGGGWLGDFIYMLLIQVTNQIAVPAILVGMWFISIYLAMALTLREMTGYVQSVFQWFGRVRGSYIEHGRARAQAKAAGAPLTIETPEGAPAGATPAAAALAAPGNKRLPAGPGAPRLAPAGAGANAAAAPAASVGRATPFGKVPVPAPPEDEPEDEELEKVAAPTAAPRPAPAPLGSRPAAATPAQAGKPGLFGSRPAAAPAKDDSTEEDSGVAAPAAKPGLAGRLPNPFGAKQGGIKPPDSAPSKPGLFGAKATSTPAKPADDATDEEATDAETDRSVPAKPATPIGNRPNPFGGPKPASPFAAKPAVGAKPADDDTDDEEDKEDDKAVPVKPSTPIGNRPNNPFGGPKPANPFAAKPAVGAKPADDDAPDEEGEKEDDKAVPVKPSTPVGNRPNNPFGGPKPANPFGAKPALGAKPADDDLGDEDKKEDDKAVPPRPATPVGNRPNNPFGGPKPASPFGSKPAVGSNPTDKEDDKAVPARPATPVGSSPGPLGGPKPSNAFGSKPTFGAKNDEDEADGDENAEEDDKPVPARPAAPTGNRPNNPFGGSKPANSDSGGSSSGPARSFGNPFAKRPASEEEAEEEPDTVDMKPATPIGNRAAPAIQTNPPRPVPKNNLATRPPLEDEDEAQDDNPKYVSVDDEEDDIPRTGGPRPTVSGGVNTPPASMPRPANPIMPRGRPVDPPRASGSSGSAPGMGGGDKPQSPFGQRPPSASGITTTPKSESSVAPGVATAAPSATHAAPAAAPAAATATATVQTSPKPDQAAAKTPPADKREEPSPKPPLEGVIVRSKHPPTTPGLPDFSELLESGVEQKISDEVLQQRAKVIEETLSSFSAPGKVVEINPGPVITQFGVEPDYLVTKQGKKIRVKVSQIAKLDDDLALALAARSIRIEAPVPGKGYVGIEVPNAETSLVGLRDIMDSEEFQKVKSKLRIGLGKSVDGAPIAADLTQMPHLLIAGTTGSGKSVCVNAIITCLLLENTPDDLKMVMVDPKRVELTGYNGIPHLVSPVVVDLERIVGVLKWVTREMEERYKKFSQAGARNILDFNGRLKSHEPKLPYLVVVIDELADLMMLAPEETEKVLTRLAQMARATGIHLIISTQRPSVDVVTGLIKANFPARISFAVASSVDSRVVLDQPGAEKLLGRGDMLFQSPDAAAPLRMQGVFVSDAAINRVTGYWKGHRPERADSTNSPASALGSPVDFNRAAEPVQSRAERFGPPPGSPRPFGNSPASTSSPSGLGTPAGSANPIASKPATLAGGSADPAGDDDEMYEEALDLVRKAGKPSISLLQRRLRVGYTRAARLIELMEKRGAISHAEASSASGDVADDSDTADQDKPDKPDSKQA